MRWAIAVLGSVCGGVCGGASAQTMTYFWTVTTDDGDTNVGVGERAYLSMWALMEPEAVGFAGTLYSILGVQNWASGEILADNLFDVFEFSIDDDNDIPSIESFQLPPLFWQGFVEDNPVEIFRIVWWTDDFTARFVEVGDANHLNNDVYTDDFGSSMAYEGVPGVARFTVAVPGPGAIGLLGLAAMRRVRR